MLGGLARLCRAQLARSGSASNGAGVGRMFSEGAATKPPTTPAETKSILDSTSAGNLGVGGELFTAAMQQQAAKQAAGAAADAAAPEAPTAFRRIFSTLFDVASYSALGGAGFCAWLYYRYPDDKELQTIHDELESQKADIHLGQLAWLTGVHYYLEYVGPLKQRVKSFTDPTTDKLLPDLLPEYRGRIKTLVLDLEEVLVHKEWTREKGWQIYKRPGVQDFLFQMGHMYEIVIYTDELNMYAEPILNRLDEHKVVAYRLFRQDTQYKDGHHVRDLSKLNRDLSQVLFISANPSAYAFQPENTLKLKPWRDQFDDTTLLDLIPFLQMVATKGVGDVRQVVKSYDGEEDVVAAFKQRMASLVQHQTAAPRKLGGLWGK